MKKYILTSFLFALSAPLFAAAWVPLIETHRSETAKNILTKDKITYQVVVLDTNENRKIPDVEKAMKAWFDNVYKRRDNYENFDKTFEDILPVLQNGIKMEKVEGNVHETFPNTDIVFVFSANRAALSCRNLETEFSISPACRRKTQYGTDIVEVWLLSGIWRISPDVAIRANPKRTLKHELGHVLGLGDLYKRGRWNGDFSEGSGLKHSLMKKAQTLTCDDADGLIGALDIALGKERTFKSFCNNNYMYHNGQYMKIKNFENPNKHALKNALKSPPAADL